MKKTFNLIQGIFGTLILLPHGGNLLTPPATIWAIFMAILIFMMAIIEATVWKVVSVYFLSSEIQSYGITPTTIFVIIFVVIWLFDASLTTLDVSEMSKKFKVKAEGKYKFIKNIGHFFAKMIFTKFGLGVVLRIVVVSVSVAVTIPLLTFVFLYDDIASKLENKISEERKKIISLTKQSHVTSRNTLENRISELNLKIGEKSTLLQEEIGGKSISGRFGSGPVAQSIKDEIILLTDEKGKKESNYSVPPSTKEGKFPANRSLKASEEETRCLRQVER